MGGWDTHHSCMRQGQPSCDRCLTMPGSGPGLWAAWGPRRGWGLSCALQEACSYPLDACSTCLCHGNQKCLQTFPDAPWGPKPPLGESETA